MRTMLLLAMTATLVASQPTAADEVSDTPPPGEARAKWIDQQVARIPNGSHEARTRAIKALIAHDQAGDCVGRLVALLEGQKKNIPVLVALVRGMGRDGLTGVAVPMTALLKHKDASVRGNATVSLEYIGDHDKKVIAALRKAAGREKDAAIANHLWRALGRCGRKDAKVRAALLKEAGSAKSEFASYGPCIGLAYFEDDEKAMRGVEQLLHRIGVPGRSATNAIKRSLVSWVLACIGDAKSAAFVREKLIARLKHMQQPWVAGLQTYWELVARTCDGEPALLPAVEEGVRGAVTYVRDTLNLGRYGAETRNLMDEYRLSREGDFTPRGDHILNDQR